MPAAASASEAEANLADLDTDEVTVAELDAVDASLDAMMLGESATSFGKGKVLLSVEQAQAKLSPEILKVLAEKFKGSLTQVRHPDERDQIF